MPGASAEDVLLGELRKLYSLSEDVSVESLTEPLKTYVTYALGTIERGRGALDRIRPHRSPEGVRYLDCGCAYGGFLAAVAQAGAAEVVGFDIDERLVDIARSYLDALDVPSSVQPGDVTDGQFMAGLGEFGLVTCNDVIEHVDSVPRCIANLGGALSDGGVLYMAIPNRRSTLLIRSDPHYHVFGIVLISRPDAIEYHTAVTRVESYDVGDYYAFDYYADLLRAQGLDVTVTNAPAASAHWCIKEMIPDWAKLREQNDAFNDERLPTYLNIRVRSAVSSVIDSFEAAVAEYEALLKAGENDRATAMSLEMTRDFYLATWYVVAKKPSR